MVRRNAWLTPDVGTGEVISRCLAFPRSMLPHVTGALSALTEVWRWESYGDMTPDDAAHLATIMLDQFTSECAANVLLRQNPTNPCQLERSDDNGETWVMFADTSLCLPDIEPAPSGYETVRENPETGELEFSMDDGVTWSDIPIPSEPRTNAWTPARSPSPGATTEEQRCHAATAAVGNLATMYEQTYGAIAAGLLNTLSGINTFLRDLNNFLADIVWGEYFDIAQALGFENTYEPTQYAAATLDQNARDALTCLLYTYATVGNQGVVSFDFNAVRDNVIAELGINPGTAIWTHLNYVGEAGLNRLADVGFGDTYCGCGGWCIEFDFTQGSYDWFNVVSDWQRGTYSAGVGFVTTNGTDQFNTRATDLYMRLDFTTPADITGISVLQDYDAGTGNMYCRVLNIGGNVLINQRGTCLEGNDIEWSQTGLNITDAEYVVIRTQSSLTAWGGSATVKRVRISGTGVKPVVSFTQECGSL